MRLSNWNKVKKKFSPDAIYFKKDISDKKMTGDYILGFFVIMF